MLNQTIYALSTVFGKSGVAVIRVSGKDALLSISTFSGPVWDAHGKPFALG